MSVADAARRHVFEWVLLNMLTLSTTEGRFVDNAPVLALSTSLIVREP